MIQSTVGFTSPEAPVETPTAAYTSTVKHLVKAGEAISKGQAVYVTGSTGQSGTNMIVGKASNATEPTSSKTMGLLESSLATNDQGYVITEGLLAGLDTSAAGAAGDPVWLGTNGNLIYGLINKPVAPAHLVFIGIVTRKQQSNGEIFVKVQNGFEVEELHNVVLTNKQDGDVIVWDETTGKWINSAIVGQPGPQGIQGETGPAGPTGATGAAGTNGTNGLGYDGVTSTTSMSIGTDTKTFTVNKSNTAFSVGSRVRIYTSNNFTAYMEGILSSISGTSWSVVVENIGTNEGVTFSSWRISLTGVVGPTGAGASDLTEWTTYTVAWTGAQANPSIGNGTLTGRYKQIGKTVFVTVKLITGTTTTFGSGDWRFSLPVTAQSPDTIQMPCSMLDNGNAWYQGTVNGTYSGFTDKTSILADTAGIASGAVTSGAPFTWGAGDSLMFNGSYEAI